LSKGGKRNKRSAPKSRRQKTKRLNLKWFWGYNVT
jgi:hypothetical protein